MKPFSAFALGATLLAASLAFPPLTPPAAAQSDPPSLTQKLNAYVGCINRLSARAYDSRTRYFSWAGKNGPTGHERIIYGTYTIYDTADCKKNVEKANTLEPHDAALEAAATAYAEAVGALEPLLKEADDYYTPRKLQGRQDGQGQALHPQLVAAWEAFAAPTRSCAARSRPSTTGARRRNSPRSSKAKASRRATMSRR